MAGSNEEEETTWENIFRLALHHLSVPITRLTNVSIYFHARNFFSIERPCFECVEGVLALLGNIYSRPLLTDPLVVDDRGTSMNYLFGQQ